MQKKACHHELVVVDSAVLLSSQMPVAMAVPTPMPIIYNWLDNCLFGKQKEFGQRNMKRENTVLILRPGRSDQPHYGKYSNCSRPRVAAWIIIMFVCAAAAAQDKTPNIDPPPNALDMAMNRMYNCDFKGAQAIFSEEIRKHPEDPLLYAFQASALLFSEFDRMKILELDFFVDDDSVTDRKRLKPDPSIRANIFQATGHARKIASMFLAEDSQDSNALFALFVASGVETDYSVLVEKKYLRSYSLSKETQNDSRKLLARNPPVYDAYLSSGILEYVVGNLNFFFKLFIHIDQIKGNKKLSVEHLKRVIDYGRYYSPYAKILLSVIYLRDKKPELALALLKEFERDFPENSLIHKEVCRISAKIPPR
jgi:hypothetical protein